MKTVLSFAVALVALVVLAGCGSGSIAGKWSGKPDVSKILANVPAAQKAEAEKAFANLAVNLELKSDKKFVLTATGMPQNPPPMEGTWEQKEKVVTFTPTTKTDKPFTGTLSEDGKTLTINDPSGMTTVPLTKTE